VKFDVKLKYDIEEQKRLVLDRIKLLFDYEFNHDGLVDTLKGQNIDLEQRSINLINSIDEYINELLLIMHGYKCADIESFSYYKKRQVKRCIKGGLSPKEACEQTNMPYKKVLEYYKKYLKID